MTFDLRMWKGQPAYLELLDEGAGYVAITEAWFADSPPPGEPGIHVPLPDPPAINTPEAKKLLDRIREIEAKLPDPQRAPTMRDGAGINERVFRSRQSQDARRGGSTSHVGSVRQTGLYRTR